MIGHNEKFFKDFINLHFRGGHGGTGAVSFENTRKSWKKGSPCGGDGGDGGDIYLIANRDNPDFSFIKSKVRIILIKFDL
jgi:GTPase involved in cell partitioning and DNA repair